MTATNHALTGAFIGLAVGNPWIAIPAAFVSHFICDVLPHYDVPGPSKTARMRTKLFLNVQILLGGALCALIVLILAVSQPTHWVLASVCAFTATTPDLLFVPRYLQTVRTGHDPWEKNWFWRFHYRIQWFQEPIGALVEFAWTIGIILLALPFLR